MEKGKHITHGVKLIDATPTRLQEGLCDVIELDIRSN